MAKPTIFVTKEPVVLDGFQAILAPSEFGFSLQCVVEDTELVDKVQAEREAIVAALQPKLKNPKRAVLKPEPWEEIAPGRFKFKFSWDAKNAPSIVDAHGTVIDDPNLKIFSGSRVKVAFFLKPYVLPDGSYGTSIKLTGARIISIGDGSPTCTPDELNDLFGEDEGFAYEDLPPAGTQEDEEF